MDAFLPLFFGLFLLVMVFVLPLAGYSSARAAKRLAEEVRRRLDMLEVELHRLKQDQRSGIQSAPALPVSAKPGLADETVERRGAETAPARRPLTAGPPPLLPAAAAPLSASAAASAPASGTVRRADALPVSSGPPASPPTPPSRIVEPAPAPRTARESPLLQAVPALNWEQFMGVKLFAWLGGFALFLAATYFVKYSFEHNLIPPAVRVALGFLLGLGLVVGGVMLQRRQYAVTSQTLCGTGIVVLYAAAFAGNALYQLPLFKQAPTFLLMSLITATAFLLAVRMNALVVAILGILGGFLTPVLLSTGEDNPVGLFSYIALLDAGLLAVALNRRWHFLSALCALGTVVLQVAWLGKFFAVAKVGTALTVFLGFDLLFLAGVWLAVRAGQGNPWFTGASAGLALLTMASAFYFMSFPELFQRPGMVFAFVFGAELCLFALICLENGLMAVQMVSGAVAFSALTAWTAGPLDHALLDWALGLYLLFAVFHTVFPLVLKRLKPGNAPPPWVHVFPVLALALILVPVLRLTDVPFLLWPVVLLVDVLAILLALATASLLPVAAVLVVTIITLAGWLWHEPVQSIDLGLALFLIAGFSVFFALAGWFGVRGLLERLPAELRERVSLLSLSRAAPPEELQAQIPALSAILPFLLLMLVVARLPMPDPSPVFGVALLLTVLLLGLARVLTLEILPAVALGCVLALEHTWHLRRFADCPTPVVPLLWYGFFAGLFVVFPFVFRARFLDKVIPWVTGAVAAPCHFYLLHRLIKATWPNDYLGLVPAVCAVPMLACLGVIVRRFPPDHARRNTVLALFGGAALFFITLIFPIQFDRQWITLGWALEGAALCWLFHRVPHPGLRLVGVGLLTVAFVRLALNPEVLSYHPRAAAALLNWYLYAYGLAAVCLFAAARLLAPPRDRVLEVAVPPVLNGLGAVLLFLLVNLEIADYFSEPGRPTLTFQFSGNFARDMSYTIAWALFALVLVIIGLTRQSRAPRYAGLGLLAFTLLKLFFHDLASLKQLYRIGALAGVAAVAIVASFLYQKYLAASDRTPGDTPSTGPGVAGEPPTAASQLRKDE